MIIHASHPAFAAAIASGWVFAMCGAAKITAIAARQRRDDRQRERGVHS